MTSYVPSPEARRDILEIVVFIAADNGSAVLRVRDRLFEAFEKLSARPALGHARLDLTDKPVRFWTVASRCLVVYRADRAPVEIVRVLGPGRDVAATLS